MRAQIGKHALFGVAFDQHAGHKIVAEGFCGSEAPFAGDQDVIAARRCAHGKRLHNAGGPDGPDQIVDMGVVII